MALYCLGSINVDFTYRVDRLPGPGETVIATTASRGLGGKGANQSIAASRAGARVYHIGRVGPEGEWCISSMHNLGVDISHVSVSRKPTGHANICVDETGENQITVLPGANLDQDLKSISRALEKGGANDWLLLQNETSHQVDAAKLARSKGMRVAYSAAPFEVESVKEILDLITLLILNEGEALQFEQYFQGSPAVDLIVTKGINGAELRRNGHTTNVPAFGVNAEDTTGAGDTFAGFLLAGLENGQFYESALNRAMAAAALQVTRRGSAEAIPSAKEVDTFMLNLKRQ